ncbi:DNA-binding transcriptional ArsR family regulator [Microbacterium resistens]|uniref:DNA-binding transcriptional ArsR family regulator n=1 Tax=Microbacterium resistens TaxID=156977 RepID=A0ABU1SBH3_9MICO|nr:helix-turn-helix domain-containing protein [Microbacterium resistens]MDR6866936.1 DNA-binding transcriptional ArsR family regulator [Microbacterium resistens]
MAEPVDRPETPLTTAMLKAFANPLRRRILRVFRTDGAVRAVDLAARLGEPANKISFHLRVLAEAGFIAERPELARDRRDRVWSAVMDGFNLGGAENPVPDQVLGDVVVQGLVDDHNERVRRLTAWASEYLSGATAEAHGTLSHDGLMLTSSEFVALLERLHQAIKEAEETHDPASGEESRFYEIDIIAADDRI